MDRDLQAEPRKRDSRHRAGGILVEFCISVMALWLIAAAIVDLGRAFSAAHLLQSAARSAAREIALDDETAWNAPFQTALERVFDPNYLVVDAGCLESLAVEASTTPDFELREALQGRVLNLALKPLMIFEDVQLNGEQIRLIRYPGALLASGQPDDQDTCAREDYTVGIPEINDEDSRIDMFPVVAELFAGSYSLETSGGNLIPPGTATLQLRYPFQAVALSAWRVVDGFNRPVGVAENDDYQADLERLANGVSTLDALDARSSDGELQAYAQNDLGQTLPVYGGRLGLGVQGVLGREVRPYRRVITAQAMAPREVIGSGSGL
ncbi:MAG: pilus assembly protein [Myxococcota bacterium]|nr:pilus assembly protein [Myxococcota bacterium]